jgi:DUF4097 and DUF4098 domain-containing protein YvlB
MSIEREFQLEGAPELDVRIQSGRVEIVGSEPGVVRVSVETSDPNFVVEQRGNYITVSSDRESSWLSRSSAIVYVEVPEGADATVATASAPVEISVPLRRLDIKTASGAIEAESAETADIRTASADVRIGSTGMVLRFKSASGDLFVTEGCHGTASVATASGDVHLKDVDASVDVNTVSGSVFFPRFTGAKASFKTMSGDIRLGIPPGTNIDLDVSALSGSLHLPESPAEKTETRRHMAVTAKLVSGDMRLDRVEA